MRAPTLNKKQAGLIIIILGILCTLFVAIFLYYKVIRIPGFPELLPANETVAYLEFSSSLPPEILKKINETWSVDWQKDVMPWAGEKGAVVLLKGSDDSANSVPIRFQPLLLLKVRSIEQAFAFMKTYKNPSGQTKELPVLNFHAYSTPTLHFVFVDSVLAISPSQAGLMAFLKAQTSLQQHLGSQSDFIKTTKNMTAVPLPIGRQALRPDTHRNSSRPFSLYIEPQQLPQEIWRTLSEYLPQMPPVVLPFSAIGISAQTHNGEWQGSSYALLEESINLGQEQAYRALLLPYLPSGFSFILAGQNLAVQLHKLEAMLDGTKNSTHIKLLTQAVTQTYLPGLDFEKDIEPMLSGEFALTMDPSKILFVLQLDYKTAQAQIEKLRESFAKIAPTFAPQTRDLELADGTKAQELIPDPTQVKTYSESFEGIAIKGFLMGRRNTLYDATTQGKWFLSTDLALLKKALSLTLEPGRSVRDSAWYRRSLSPIMKNPELLGMAILREGIFAFTKRTLSDSMETQFTFTTPAL